MSSSTPAAQRWTRIIDQQEASGLTIRAFAETVGVNPRTLAWWRWELGRTQAKKPEPSALAFVEVALEPEADRDAAPLVIELDGCDAHIRVDARTDLRLLRRVLEALA